MRSERGKGQVGSDTTSYVYDSDNNLVETIDPDHHTTSNAYDGAGNLILSVTGYGTSLAEVTSYSYNAAGELTRTIDDDGNTTSEVYDSNGNMTESITGKGTLSEATSYAYDNDGNVTLTTTGYGGTDPETTTQSYDANGNLTFSAIGDETTVYGYDGDNNPISTIIGSGTATLSYGSAYDPFGNVTHSWVGSDTTSYAYDSDNNLVETIDPDTDTTSNAYDSAGNLILSVTGYGTSLAEVTSYSYNAAGELTLTVDDDGNTTSQQYDQDGNVTLSVVSNSDSTLTETTSYGYDGDGNVTETVNGLGNSDSHPETTTQSYDANGNLTFSAIGDETTVYGYDGDNNPISTIIGSGTATLSYGSAYDPFGNVTQSWVGSDTTSYVYDSDNNLVETIDPDHHTTSNAYDSAGNLILSVTGYGTSLAEVTSYSYNAAGELTRTIDDDGNTTSEVYDSNGNMTESITGKGTLSEATSYAYDNDGNVTLTTTGYGGTDPETTTQSYDANGNLTFSAIGDETTVYGYDGDNNPISTIIGSGTATLSYGSAYDPFGNVTHSWVGSDTTSYAYDSDNNLVETIDPDTDTTSNAYDGVGNMTLSVTGYGTSAAEPTSYSFDGEGRQTLIVEGSGTLAITTSQAYDGNGNMTLSVTGNGTGNETTSYAYDSDGNVTLTIAGDETTSQAYDANGNVTLSIVENTSGAEKTFYGYDNDNNVTLTVTGYGSGTPETTSQAYDPFGNVTLSVDAMDDTTSYAYDSDNNCTLTVSVNPGGANSTISESYDAEGDLVYYQDASGNATSFTYNAEGQQTGETTPTGSSTTVYNADDEVASTVDANGRTISYQYDGDGNVTTESWINSGGSVVEVMNFSYDADGNITYASNSAGTYSYEYDSEGEKTQQTFTFTSGGSMTLSYSYDGEGSVTQVTDSQGDTTSYAYNGDGLLATEIVTSSTTVARSEFDYDAEQQLTQVLDYTTASGGTISQLEVDYSYDANGNMTTEIETSASVGLVTYVDAYDLDNRITSEVRTGVETGATVTTTATTTYSYNAESEVASDNSSSYSYNANGDQAEGGFTTGTDNEITSDGTWTYSYDAVGNMISKTETSVTWSYGYDFNNRLISATETADGTVAQEASYSYDVYGNLVGETTYNSAYLTGDGTSTLKFAYDGNTIYADLDGSGNVTTLYITGGQAGQFFGRITDGTIYWMVQDRLGSVREVISADGSMVLNAITYDAFGNITNQTDAAYQGNYTFTGYYQDPVTGYYITQQGNRVLDPQIAQFLQVDPLGVGGGLSNFRDYVGNDATNATDPSGMESKTGQAPNNSDSAILRQIIADSAAAQSEVWKWEEARRNFFITYRNVPSGFAQELNEKWSKIVEQGSNARNRLEQLNHVIALIPWESLLDLLDGASDEEAAVIHKESNRRLKILLREKYTKETRNLAAAAELQELLKERQAAENRPLEMALSVGLSLVPVVGQLVGSYEAISGEDIFGKKLSGTEQVIVGASVALPVLGYTVSKVVPLLKVSPKGLRIAKELEAATAKTVKAAQTGQGVADAELSLKNAVRAATEELKQIASASKGCFAAGTPLLTSDGAMPIEQFKVGDFILSRDENDAARPVQAKQVEEVFVRLSPILELRVSGQVIGTTHEHPFYVVGKGWVAAVELREGDYLVSHNGDTNRVESVFDNGEVKTVYNLRVADYHTYFVGDSSWGFSVWAHNACTLRPGELETLGAEYAQRINAQAARARGVGSTADIEAALPAGGWDEIAALRSGKLKGTLSAEDKAAIRNYVANSQTLLDEGVSIRVPSPTGRNGTLAHRTDVAANNAQESGKLLADPVGGRVPDGVGRTGQKVVIRGVEIDPGPNGRVIVESEPFSGDIPVSDGRAQLRDIRRADRGATLVVTDPENPARAPLIYPPGTQPPPPGHYRGGRTFVPAARE